jgi:hypothetical protein
VPWGPRNSFVPQRIFLTNGRGRRGRTQVVADDLTPFTTILTRFDPQRLTNHIVGMRCHSAPGLPPIAEPAVRGAQNFIIVLRVSVVLLVRSAGPPTLT